MKFFLIFPIFLFVQITSAFAQTSRITGTVTDAVSGQPLQDVHVFIPNTTFQAFTDSLGAFLISNIPEGKWSIEVWGQGWATHREAISLKAGMPRNLGIKLPQNTSLDPVPMEVAKSQRAKILELVLQAFIGPDFEKRGVTLLNPDKLKFEQLGDNSLRVYSQGAIFFSNGETGYLVSVYFSPFVLGSGEEIQASYSYFELAAEEREKTTRREKRMEIYNQSPQRFLSQLMTGSLTGFDKNPNPEVSFAESSGDYYLSFAKPLSVKLPDGTQGTLDYLGEKLEVKLNGAPVMEEDLLLTGGLLSRNPIFSLPSNFNADKLIKLANLEKTAETMQERIFVHTDRKHYWSGENLYFKAYFNYVNPLLSAELSEVLHVELLDSAGYPLLHQVFKIQGGLSSGYLQLPDLGSSENILLRAYTAWGQNYANVDFFLPIQILGPMNQPEPTKLRSEAVGVGVFSDKQIYQGGEQVKLNIMAFDASGNPVNANLSVSVLDLNQAVALPDGQLMKESFGSKTAWSKIENFYSQPEKDFSLQGQLLDRAGEPVEGTLKAFVNGYTDVRSLKSDKAGRFELPNSNFGSEFEIALQAVDREARPVKDISLELKRYPSKRLPDSIEFPAVVSRGIKPPPELVKVRPMEMGEVLMEEAVIETKRENSIGPMIYGYPDKVVETKDLFLTGSPLQFLYALASRVAGMTVGGNPPAVRLRGGEPLVLINGVPANTVGGMMLSGGGGRTVYDVVNGLDMFLIEKVEVIRRLVPQYGDQGTNGIISIFLKTGLDRANAIEANMNNYSLFKLKGYPDSGLFEELEKARVADPLLSAYKPTLYWNPTLIAEESRLAQQVEFYLNPKSGPIYIEIRGITDLGVPVFGSFILNQESPANQ
jgi:hypothetical protein